MTLSIPAFRSSAPVFTRPSRHPQPAFTSQKTFPAATGDVVQFSRKPVRFQGDFYEEYLKQQAEEVARRITVPEGAKPSRAFMESMHKAVSDLMLCMDPPLLALLKQRNFRFSVYHHPDEYMDGWRKPGDISPDRSAINLSRSLLRQLKPELSDRQVDELLMKASKAQLGLFRAYYAMCRPEVIVHEKIRLPDAATIAAWDLDIEAMQNLPDMEPGLLMHELGHFIDNLPGTADKRLFRDPRFQQKLFQDLDNAIARGDQLYERTEDGQYRPNKEFREKYLTTKEGAEIPEITLTQDSGWPEYYIPTSPNDIRGLGEAFAEILACTGIFGGACQDRFAISHILYPETTRWMKEEFIPEICRRFGQRES